MRRSRIAAALLIALSGIAAIAQQTGALKIRVTIVDADGQSRPVPRHALLISDNPATGAPQRVITAIDGTADIRLRPGNYTVESDQPLIFQGKSYQWAQTLDVAAGRDAVLQLTTANAQIEAAGLAPAPAEGSASAILLDWQTSIVSIWSPTRLGSGFVIDARGLIATSQRIVGNATSVEIQISPERKFAARVLAADVDKGVAVVWVDPQAIVQARAVRLGYAQDGKPSVGEKDTVFAITAPLYDQKSVTSGKVSRVETHGILSTIRVEAEDAGVPLFNTAGAAVGIVAPEDEASTASRAVRIDEARAVIADAEKKMQGGPPPRATPLPVEPERPTDNDALREAAKSRAGRPGAYLVNAANFDVSILTPVLLYGAQHRGDRAVGPTRGRVTANPEALLKSMRALQEFANWEDYVNDYPPVVMIRATPKMVENFWKTIARGAASTQGMSLPALKHIKAGFSSMRLYCGDAEVTPIHPFKIEQRVSENDVIYEGLYVFDPRAIGPQCAAVTLTLFSDQASDKPDTRAIDAKILQQIRQDFLPGGGAP